MWINNREQMPTRDELYVVQVVTGEVCTMNYTVEGGWNTYRDRDGALIGSGLPREWVARWFEIPDPEPVPQEWYDEFTRMHV